MVSGDRPRPPRSGLSAVPARTASHSVAKNRLNYNWKTVSPVNREKVWEATECERDDCTFGKENDDKIFDDDIDDNELLECTK